MATLAEQLQATARRLAAHADAPDTPVLEAARALAGARDALVAAKVAAELPEPAPDPDAALAGFREKFGEFLSVPDDASDGDFLTAVHRRFEQWEAAIAGLLTSTEEARLMETFLGELQKTFTDGDTPTSLRLARRIELRLADIPVEAARTIREQREAHS